jgi:hypothetical protein
MSARRFPRRLTPIDAAILHGLAAQRILLLLGRWRRHIAAHRRGIGGSAHRGRWISRHPGGSRLHPRVRRHRASRLPRVRIGGWRRRGWRSWSCRRGPRLSRRSWGGRRRTLSGRRRRIGCGRLRRSGHILRNRNAGNACAEGQYGRTCQQDRFHRDHPFLVSPRSAVRVGERTGIATPAFRRWRRTVLDAPSDDPFRRSAYQGQLSGKRSNFGNSCTLPIHGSASTYWTCTAGGSAASSSRVAV